MDAIKKNPANDVNAILSKIFDLVNVNSVNAKNEPVPGSTPAVILLQGKTKTNLDKTMDGKKLAAGNSRHERC